MSDASVGKRLLFLTDVWTVGGIERVTVTLANALAARGWEVAVAIEAVADGTLLGDLAPAIRVVTLAGRNRAERTASLRRALRELKVGVLVNQRAHQYKKSRMAHLAARGLGVRVVEALHASIGFDERTLDASGLRRRWRAWKTRRHYRLTYARCDAFVVLSERLIPELRRFAGLRETTKCVAIANPLTPIYPYLPIVIGMAQKYDKKTGIGTIISMTLPYSVAFLLVWIVQVIVWIVFDLPLGPGASVFM